MTKFTQRINPVHALFITILSLSFIHQAIANTISAPQMNAIVKSAQAVSKVTDEAIIARNYVEYADELRHLHPDWSKKQYQTAESAFKTHYADILKTDVPGFMPSTSDMLLDWALNSIPTDSTPGKIVLDLAGVRGELKNLQKYYADKNSPELQGDLTKRYLNDVDKSIYGNPEIKAYEFKAYGQAEMDAHTDPGLKQDMDAETKDTLGQTVDQPSQDLIKSDPNAFDPEVFNNNIIVINQDGSYSGTLKDFQNAVTIGFKDVNTTLTDGFTKLQNQLADIRKTQPDPIKAAKDTETTKTDYLNTIKGIQGTFSVLSAIATIGFKDPKLGNQIAVIGQATLTIATAIETIVTATSVGVAIGGIGAIAGAVVGIVAVFSTSQPHVSPEEVLSRQLNGLSDQVVYLSRQVLALQMDVNANFQVIDSKLDALFTVMNADFAELITQHQVAIQKLDEIQSQLNDIQSSVTRLSENVYLFFKTQDQNILNDAIVAYIGHPHLDPIQFFSANDSIVKYTLNRSTDAILAGGISGRSKEDYNIFNELHKYPADMKQTAIGSDIDLGYNIDYLAGLPAQKFGLPSLTTSATPNLANPLEWAHGSLAYLQLTAEHPKYFEGPMRKNGTLSDVQKMISLGKDLQESIARITTNDINKGPANHALFNTLVENYNKKVDSLQELVNGYSNAYASTHKNTPGDGGVPIAGFDGLDIWNNADQQPFTTAGSKEWYAPAAPGGLRQAEVGDGQNAGDQFMKRPDTVPNSYRTYISRLLRTGEKLGLGSIKWWVKAEWVDVYEVKKEPMPCPLPPLEKKTDDDIYTGEVKRYGYLRGSLYVSFNDEGTLCRISRTDPNSTLIYHSLTNVCGKPSKIDINLIDPYTALADAWQKAGTFYNWFQVNLAGKEFNDGLPNGLDPNIESTLRGQINTALHSARFVTYRGICKALLAQSTSSLDTVTGAEHDAAIQISNAAQSLDGAKALIDSYISLGMSRSLQDDDALHEQLFGLPDKSDKKVFDRYLLSTPFLTYADNAEMHSIGDIFAEVKRRSSALSVKLTEILNQVDQFYHLRNAAGLTNQDMNLNRLPPGYPEPASVVKPTLDKLKMYEIYLAH